MPRVKHRARLVLAVALLVAVLLAPGIVVPRDALAKNTYTIHKHTITITVPVVVIGRNAEATAKFHTQAFNAAWGKPGGFKHGCFTVVFKLDIKASQNEEAGRHTVFRVPLDPGQVWTSEVYRKPGATSYTVYTSVNDSLMTLEHEYGHVLGLPDEYTVHYKDGKRYTRPDPNKVPEYQLDGRGNVVLKPGETRSIMAERGYVLPRQIATIVKAHVPSEKLKCNWQGSLDYRVLASGPEGQGTITNLMAFTMEEDDAGVLNGTGSATIANEGGGTQDCGTYSHRIEPVTLEIAVTGQRTDATMTLHFAPLGDTQTTNTYTTCGDPFTHPVDAWLLGGGPLLTPSLAPLDDTFVLDDYIVGADAGGTIETWLVVVVEPADAEGVPVG